MNGVGKNLEDLKKDIEDIKILEKELPDRIKE
jgi:hypothetical protein